MDEHVLWVGESLRRTRLSPKALRLYGGQGLLVPDRVDPHTGYRWYAASQVERARLIGLLRGAGMPLARIRALVDLPGPDRLAAVDRWWADVEADVRRRRELVAHLHRQADREAVTTLTRGEAEFPGILDAYDAVARWCDDAGLVRTGSPAEVYLGPRDVPADQPHPEVAWPVG